MFPFVPIWKSAAPPQDAQRLIARTFLAAGAIALIIITGVEIALLDRDVDPASVAGNCQSLTGAQSRLACYEARDHQPPLTSFKTSMPSSLYATR